MIDREDMLELSRRMTTKRTHFIRIAGAYIDEEGYVDGTFNTNFLKLKNEEKEHVLDIAKSLPLAKTNEELIEYKLQEGAFKKGSIWQLLYALRDCELKNDALLLNFYELLSEKMETGKQYAIYIFQGLYDVPAKASDKERLEDSNEVYSYLMCALCPVYGDYETDMPLTGFIWPAFKDRSTDLKRVNILEIDKGKANQLKEFLKKE